MHCCTNDIMWHHHRWCHLCNKYIPWTIPKRHKKLMFSSILDKLLTDHNPWSWTIVNKIINCSFGILQEPGIFHSIFGNKQLNWMQIQVVFLVEPGNLTIFNKHVYTSLTKASSMMCKNQLPFPQDLKDLGSSETKGPPNLTSRTVLRCETFWQLNAKQFVMS